MDFGCLFVFVRRVVSLKERCHQSHEFICWDVRGVFCAIFRVSFSTKAHPRVRLLLNLCKDKRREPPFSSTADLIEAVRQNRTRLVNSYKLIDWSKAV